MFIYFFRGRLKTQWIPFHSKLKKILHRAYNKVLAQNIEWVKHNGPIFVVLRCLKIIIKTNQIMIIVFILIVF